MPIAIGSLDWTSWKGRLRAATVDAVTYTRPQVNGYGVRFDAWRAEVTDIAVNKEVPNLAAAQAIVLAARKLVTQTVPVSDPLGLTLICQVISAVETINLLPNGKVDVGVVFRLIPPSSEPT